MSPDANSQVYLLYGDETDVCEERKAVKEPFFPGPFLMFDGTLDEKTRNPIKLH